MFEHEQYKEALHDLLGDLHEERLDTLVPFGEALVARGRATILTGSFFGTKHLCINGYAMCSNKRMWQPRTSDVWCRRCLISARTAAPSGVNDPYHA
jgi:hypothetical protein